MGLPKLHGSRHARARRLLTRPTLGQAQAGEDAYAVPEHSPPLCSAHFCIHWVDSTVPGHVDDRPPLVSNDGDTIPDYVQTMEPGVRARLPEENVQLGWRIPDGDGTAAAT